VPPINGTEGIATFTDNNPGAVFAATIDWGDGATSPGTVTKNNSGGFSDQLRPSTTHMGRFQ
jgi:hypothetical protein